MKADSLTRPRLDRRLAARTPEGAEFVQLCEDHSAAFAPRAERHDREGTFGFESWEELRASGALRACIPTELGGLGVTSLHDIAVGISRLAEGDASMAIGANMHLALPWGITRSWLAARTSGDAHAEQQLASTLSIFGTAVFSGPNTEPANSCGIRPATTATRTDGGYLINGRKSFGTNAPLADVFGFWVTITDPGGEPSRMATAIVPRGTIGMTIHDDWDALGMRASGSCSVVFEQCLIPDTLVREIGIVGHWDPAFVHSLVGITFPLVGTFLGIAEAALRLGRQHVKTKRKGPSNTLLAERHGIQQLIAEAEIELAAARAALSRTGRLIDDLYATAHAEEVTEADSHELLVDFQCTNVIVKRAAVQVVDKVMNAVGGSSYMSGHPLARHWRDVRAGSFMQPFTPVEAYRYIASIALGLPPALDG